MNEAYPLDWPEGWPRTAPNRRERADSHFGSAKFPLVMGRALGQLRAELKLLGAQDLIVSSNVQLRRDGMPYSETRKIDDPGVAIYFGLKGKRLAMARDSYDTVAGNIRALTLAISAIRAMERHGGSYMMERAFSGFLALPSPTGKRPWRAVFGVASDWDGDLAAAFREKAKLCHPDVNGGDGEAMAELNVAFAEGKMELGQ